MIWKLMASKPEYVRTHSQMDKLKTVSRPQALDRQRHKTNPANHLFIMAIIQVNLR